MQNLKNRLSSAVLLGSVMVAGAAHAALPTEATAAFTTVSGNVTDIFAAIWPIVAVVTGGFVLIRLFKKGTGAI